MISIVMDGKCKGCFFADLELTPLPVVVNGKLWLVHCKHEKACDAMEERCKQEVTANDS